MTNEHLLHVIAALRQYEFEFERDAEYNDRVTRVRGMLRRINDRETATWTPVASFATSRDDVILLRDTLSRYADHFRMDLHMIDEAAELLSEELAVV